jgi:tRNA A-37 threonylcarbamoyl transferase component Bud32
MRGVVITRLIDGPTVAEDYLARRNARTVDRAAESLARIHRAGLAHGDPRLRNFLVSGETILAFDLCSWGRLSERRRREDLVKFLGSTMTITEHAAAERWLETYAAASAWKCVNAEQLMLHAAAYAKKERVP